jgi:uncharacterized protein (TIGR00369 family)
MDRLPGSKTLMHLPTKVWPIIEARPLHPTFGDLKGHWLYKMELRTRCNAGPTDVSGVFRNKRFDENNPRKRIIDFPRSKLIHDDSSISNAVTNIANSASLSGMDIKKLRLNPIEYAKFFEEADKLCAQLNARFLSINEHECIYEYTVSPEHFNPNGILHGGTLYAIMDSSQGAFVHFSLDETYLAAATGTATIKYFKPVRGGKIRIRTWLKEKQGRKIFISSLATDEAGIDVASLEEIWIAIPKPT